MGPPTEAESQQVNSAQRRRWSGVSRLSALLCVYGEARKHRGGLHKMHCSAVCVGAVDAARCPLVTQNRAVQLRRDAAEGASKCICVGSSKGSVGVDQPEIGLRVEFIVTALVLDQQGLAIRRDRSYARSRREGQTRYLPQVA